MEQITKDNINEISKKENRHVLYGTTANDDYVIYRIGNNLINCLIPIKRKDKIKNEIRFRNT